VKIHEYQAKKLFSKYKIPVPRGSVAFHAGEAVRISEELSGFPVVVKAQIHAGGRGKGGGIKTAADPDEVETLAGQGHMFNLEVAPPPNVDIFLSEKRTLKIGEQVMHFLHTPGHSPGSYSFLINSHLFAGDVLFKDSIGRTDLYGGDYTVLIRSIMDKLLTLPDATALYPGHGPASTIGREKRSNPFLRS